MPQFDKNKVASIVDQITTDLDKLLKADGDDDMDDKSPAASASAPPPAASAPAPTDGTPPPVDQSPGAPPAASPDADPAQDQSPELTPETLQAEYASLDLPTLQMHVQAANAALEQVAGQGAAGSAAAPPPAASAAPPPDMSAGGPPVGKSEQIPAALMARFEKAESQIKSFKKSVDEATSLATARAAEVEELKKSLADRDKQLTQLGNDAQKILARVAPGGVPVRKSVSRASDIPAPAPKPGTAAPAVGSVDLSKMTKAEVTARLSEITKTHKLEKSERAAVMSYTAGGASAEVVAPILNKFAQ